MERVNRGKFIVGEGGSGCGKTTQIWKLHTNGVLASNNWYITREPGGTAFGDRVRDAVQGMYDDVVDPYAALFAYASSRANLVRTEIIPRIKQGKNVMLDRYWYSTYAYQGAEGISKPVIWAINMLATRGLKPDLVLHFDLLPEVGIKRKKGLDDEDRYDAKRLEFHKKVRENYMQLKIMYPWIWKIIDANGSIDEVYIRTKSVLEAANII